MIPNSWSPPSLSLSLLLWSIPCCQDNTKPSAIKIAYRPFGLGFLFIYKNWINFNIPPLFPLSLPSQASHSYGVSATFAAYMMSLHAGAVELDVGHRFPSFFLVQRAMKLHVSDRLVSLFY